MIRRLLVKILVGAVALWGADYFLAGFSVAGGLRGYLIAGVILGALNFLVRPIVKTLTKPLIWLTLGLFTLVINAAMLWLAARISGAIMIADLTSLALATLIISVAHIIFDHE
jgi:putative membrane protein